LSDRTATCSDTDLDIEVIISAISLLRPDEAVGPDEPSPKLLLEVSNEIACPLLLLFRESFDESCVPHDRRQANITPLFKKGIRNEVGNYRPAKPVLGKGERGPSQGPARGGAPRFGAAV